jgi:uncharacterized protein (DUF2236 family)
MRHSIARRINAERVLLLSWPRAILLQLAHPLVAAGVADHSSFRKGPATAARRLHETVRAMLSLTFGDEAAHAQTIASILAIHRRVNGTLRSAVGPFPAGTPYTAEDPDLVLWVHTTLIESVLDLYQRVIEPLTDQARDAYCAEAAEVAVELGARVADVPHTWTALVDYLATTHRSGTIVVGPDAKAVAGAVLSPPLPLISWPAGRLVRRVTLGLLPANLRAQYGHGWTARDERRFVAALRRVQRLRRLTPRRLALWPEARFQIHGA